MVKKYMIVACLRHAGVFGAIMRCALGFVRGKWDGVGACFS